MGIRKMNLPNKLTMIRVLLIPIIVAVMMIDVSWFDLLALILFIIGSVTDFVDGKIARKRNLVTDFGKLMDPLADKMMVISVLMMFVAQNRINAIPVIVIVVRELAVTGLRAVAASSQNGGKVIAASIWGKAKTMSQMITVILLFLNVYITKITSFPITDIGVWIMTILTIISGAEYFIQAKECFKDC